MVRIEDFTKGIYVQIINVLKEEDSNVPNLVKTIKENGHDYRQEGIYKALRKMQERDLVEYKNEYVWSLKKDNMLKYLKFKHQDKLDGFKKQSDDLDSIKEMMADMIDGNEG